jgi:predicted cytidylate kinase
MIITISGTAGSGKSTVAKLLAVKLGLKHYSTGDFMRDIAKERNLSLEELGKIAEGDRSIDEQLDRRQVKLGKEEDDFVIDGRLSFYFIPTSIKIFLDAELRTRAERIYQDITVKGKRKEEKSENIREIIEKIKKREECEKKRYMKYYGLNPYDHKRYDLVIDTTEILPEKVVEKIVKEMKG